MNITMLKSELLIIKFGLLKFQALLPKPYQAHMVPTWLPHDSNNTYVVVDMANDMAPHGSFTHRFHCPINPRLLRTQLHHTCIRSTPNILISNYQVSVPYHTTTSLTYLLSIPDMSILSYRVSTHSDASPTKTLDKWYVSGLVGTLDMWPSMDSPSGVTCNTCGWEPFTLDNLIRSINQYYIKIPHIRVLFI